MPVQINSQSLEDTQVGYISQKYTLDKYTLEKKLKNKYTFGNTLLEIQIVDEIFYLQLHSNRHICPHTSIVDENFLSTILKKAW